MRSKSRRERSAGTAPGWGRRSGGELPAATCAPCGEHLAAALRLHARTEAVLLGAVALLGLVGSLGHWASEAPLGERCRACRSRLAPADGMVLGSSLGRQGPEHGAAAPPAGGSYTTPSSATADGDRGRATHDRGGSPEGPSAGRRRLEREPRTPSRGVMGDTPLGVSRVRVAVGRKSVLTYAAPATGNASGKPTASDRRPAVEEGRPAVTRTVARLRTGVASARERAGSEGTTAAGTAAIDGREAGVARRTR